MFLSNLKGESVAEQTKKDSIKAAGESSPAFNSSAPIWIYSINTDFKKLRVP
jgi:hypothetical protein